MEKVGPEGAITVEGEPLATLVVNKLRGVLSSVAVKAPGPRPNRFTRRSSSVCHPKFRSGSLSISSPIW
jgi:hypothetical protein